MSTIGTRQAPIARVILRLIANQRVTYTVSLLLWVTIWTMPVLLGVIAAQYFDGLTGQAPGWNTTTVVAAMAAWITARVVTIFIGLRLHSAILFRAGASMMQNMLGWIFSLPGAQPVDKSSGEVVSRFRDDVEHTIEAFDYTVDLAGSVVSAIVAVVVLFRIDPVITVTVFAPMAVVVALTSTLGNRIRRYRTAARDATEEITGYLGETFGSVQSVKVAGAETSMLNRFDTLNERRRAMMVRDRTFTAALEAVFHNTVSIGTGAILLLAVGSLTAASGGLSIGDFTLFVSLLGMVTEAAWFMGLYIARMKQAAVSVERMVGLMDGSDWADLTKRRQLEDQPEVRLPTLPATFGGSSLLSVRGLGYHHPGSLNGISDIDLDVLKGQFVVVTGRIGAGKSTLLRAILGLLPAQAGEIHWRGVEVADPATFMVPPRAAYTPQVPRLFSLSLRDNLLLGHDASDSDLQSALATATLEHDVAGMPEGFDTLVGPRGVRLSGGQIQRSAAARMLVRTPELLVFDDLSSALDVETEAALWSRLFSEHDGATALVVSHRRPALLRADQVIVLEGGRVSDRGTAPELLDRSQAFRELWG